ncbi:MAG: hypothetical protein HOE48_19755 [Candidatus Latescibacteria bacterium]|nr:hypothetical protein [Candidatus Latescibacterota bacterium]MBT4140163.1 hypothetical protein [Candidatus Latescibacterota bacterium]MBT5832249.1 hypothetical protein [Candidatus Latescibacterota bacterium]
MRLDVFLNTCCIVKRRTEAKRACDNGIVSVDGQVTKASRDVVVGQHVHIAFTDRHLEFEIIDVPTGNVSRKNAAKYYQVLRNEARELAFF